MTSLQRQKLTEPLGTVTAIFGSLLLVAVVVAAVLTLAGSGSVGGIGHAAICATQPRAGYGGEGWTSHLGVAARPGATISINGTIQACTTRPTAGQRILYTLMSLPGFLVWAGVLFLLWRMIRSARRDGPFTAEVAAAMRRLGVLIVAGTAVAGVVQGFALDQLLNTMVVPRDHFGDMITQPISALVPVPVIAGAALLTFARIIKAGAAMDDEIQGTV